MRAGAVAHAGTMLASGVRKRHTKKQHATTRDVRPVLPPAATPDADSTNVVQVDVPRTAPVTVAMESHAMHWSRLIGSPFSSMRSAWEAVPYKVPIVSNISTRQKVMMYMIALKTPPTNCGLNACSHEEALNTPTTPISVKSLNDCPICVMSKEGVVPLTR